jgi:hypothetical protein
MSTVVPHPPARHDVDQACAHACCMRHRITASGSGGGKCADEAAAIHDFTAFSLACSLAVR